MLGGVLQLLLEPFLFGDIVNDAQHQLVAVNLNGPGVGLHVAGTAISEAMDKIERLMSAWQTGDFGHYRQDIAAQGVYFPGVLAAHRIVGIAVKIERGEVSIHNLPVAGGVD
ncbi:hypothetical protein D3C79_795810 [compost metagenome]